MSVTIIEPAPPPEPRLANLVQVSRVGGSLALLIDGEPFPYALGGVHTALGDEGGAAAVELVLLAARVEFVDQPTAPEPERVPVPSGIAQVVAGVVGKHPAVTYHPQDPNAAAIEQACRDNGLLPVPSSSVQPRSIYGVPGPAEGGRRG